MCTTLVCDSYGCSDIPDANPRNRHSDASRRDRPGNGTGAGGQQAFDWREWQAKEAKKMRRTRDEASSSLNSSHQRSKNGRTEHGAGVVFVTVSGLRIEMLIGLDLATDLSLTR